MRVDIDNSHLRTLSLARSSGRIYGILARRSDAAWLAGIIKLKTCGGKCDWSLIWRDMSQTPRARPCERTVLLRTWDAAKSSLDFLEFNSLHFETRWCVGTSAQTLHRRWCDRVPKMPSTSSTHFDKNGLVVVRGLVPWRCSSAWSLA